MNFYKRIKKLEAQQRRRYATWAYLRNGVCAPFKRPYTVIFPLFVIVLAFIAWHKRTDIPLLGGSSNPMLAKLWEYSISAAIVVLAVTFFLLSLVLIGRPRGAKRIENGLALAKVVDRYGYPPILVDSRKATHGNVKIWEFYSRGIPREHWEGEKTAIEDVLNVRFVEGIKYGRRGGNNRNYIVLTVAHGANILSRGPLYDDEL